jgi:hypothetical protein
MDIGSTLNEIWRTKTNPRPEFIVTHDRMTEMMQNTLDEHRRFMDTCSPFGLQSLFPNIDVSAYADYDEE